MDYVALGLGLVGLYFSVDSLYTSIKLGEPAYGEKEMRPIGPFSFLARAARRRASRELLES